MEDVRWEMTTTKYLLNIKFTVKHLPSSIFYKLLPHTKLFPPVEKTLCIEYSFSVV